MKKFISLALTAAMVASLVPATAFAKTKDGDTYNGTVSVVNAWNNNKDFNGNVNKSTGKDVPEVQIRVGDVNYQGTGAGKTARFTVRLDNANFFTKDEVDAIKAGNTAALDKLNGGIRIRLNPSGVGAGNGSVATKCYYYEELTTNQLKTLLGQVYDELNGGSDADFTDLYAITKSAITAAKATEAGAIAAEKANAGDGAALAAGVMSANANNKQAVTALAGQWGIAAGIGVPGSMDIDAVRNAALTVYCGANGAGNGTVTQNKMMWTNDFLGTGMAGWFDKTDNTTATNPSKFVKETDVIADASGAAASYYVAAGIDVAHSVGVSNGHFAPVEKGNMARQTWIDAQASALNMSTAGNGSSAAGLYYEKYGTIGVDRPATGFDSDREEIIASVASRDDVRRNEIIVTVTNPDNASFLEKGDIISVDLSSVLENASKDAGVSVTSSDFTLTNDNADFTYVNVDKEALQLSIRKVVDVAEDEVVTLDDKGLKIAANVGLFRTNDDGAISLKLSKGFKFVAGSINNADNGKDFDVAAKKDGAPSGNANVEWIDDQELKVTVTGEVNEITIYGIDVKADSAKIDKVATIKATSSGFNASAAVEVAKVVDYIVNLTVDEDEDVPVIYSGVDVDNTGLTDDSDHWSLDVTAKESFPGAWSFRKGFNFELPDHVFVTDVEVISTENFLRTVKDTPKEDASDVGNDQVFNAFFNAYQNGSHVNFEFDKRVFDDVDAKLTEDPAEMTFRLQLVADTGFEGDVPLKLTGELLDEQEVTIAKFVKPYEVKAEQNDIIIDYRYTDIPTAITITEAEAGLWDKDKANFTFKMEKADKTFLAFEDATFVVDSKSGMEIDDDVDKDNGRISFEVTGESDEAATVTIDGIQMFMNRSIPAGPYDLDIASSLDTAYHNQMLFAPDVAPATAGVTEKIYDDWVKANRNLLGNDPDNDDFIDNVEDCAHTVKEAFINVVTAGRDVDDASFTTKVVVPVGENYIVAGEKQIELDTPAYINAAGYTMLPIRAVATALGINNNNVLWDQPTKTVTILYGQRIITMTQGQKVVYVNGSAIPASAAVENTNSRTFLPMRDLATALGVTDITWDQATRTATLNGNQKGNQ